MDLCFPSPFVTLLTFFVFCVAADKPLKKVSLVRKTLKPGWESSILLDGAPVDRFVVSSRPGRSHHFTKWDRDSRADQFEDVGKAKGLSSKQHDLIEIGF